ncbi:MAG: glycosyltransferase, partial [Thermoplasmata archaeon]
MTSPLRILVATPLPATVIGGIEEYAYSVIEELRVRGNEVTVLTTRYGATGVCSPPPGVTLLDAKEFMGRPWCFRLRSYLGIVPRVRRADVVHVHMPFPFVECVVAVAAKVMRKPLVVTYHMDAMVEGVGGRSHPLHRLVAYVYRRVSAVPTVELAGRVCTNSRAYALQSPVLRPRMDRVIVVHQGIDGGKFRHLSRTGAAEVRRQFLGDQYSQLVCFVGRLVPYKGLRVLLEAIQTLHRAGTLFVIGGRGPQEASLRRLIEEKGLTNV